MKELRLKILGHNVTVVYSDPDLWALHAMGKSGIKYNRIMINSTMPADTQASTLLHEVIHYILDMHGFKESSNETLTNAIALGLFQFLRDNKEVLPPSGDSK